MINPQLIQELQTITQEFWDAEIQKPGFWSSVSGKDAGHSIAHSVDQKTTDLLHGKYDVRFEYGPKVQRARSMGDFWLLDNGILHPVNVKTGVTTSKSPPNVVSLNKLLEALLNCQIDSYYLLIIKFSKSEKKVAVRMVDILDYINCLIFDAGPGQLMLKQEEFAQAVSPNPPLSLDQKIAKLFEKLVTGHTSLIENRAKTLKEKQKLYDQYTASNKQINQSDQLKLHP